MTNYEQRLNERIRLEINYRLFIGADISDHKAIMEKCVRQEYDLASMVLEREGNRGIS